ncbi:MAG TPA: 4Fe-4S binding protein [Chryseosolibacter sp.]|nr:4Fe-4S binding protein [Chryseosolibacter sp.]
MSGRSGYWFNLIRAISSVRAGLKITFRHLLSARFSTKPKSIADNVYFALTAGISTIQYPHESLPVPDNGRYRLHNEIDDCIVCDKCAKICPVDCIDIEPIKAVEEIGKTSDGTPKRIYAARFDIDMAKCCFCGLCTTVCPTECLTMTKVYDFSVSDIREHNFVFAEMSEELIAEKKKAFEEFQHVKSLKSQGTPSALPPTAGESPSQPPLGASAKPVFKPRIKPPGTTPSQ